MRPRRPTYMLVALMLCWFVGLRTLHDGYLTIRILQNPLAADAFGLPDLVTSSIVDALADGANVSLPLGIAHVLLGGLLILVSSGLMFGGRFSVSFGLQVLGANAGLALLSYALGGPVRAAMIDSLLKLPPMASQPEEVSVARSAYYWAFRVGLGAHLGILAAAAHALTRRAARAFLAGAVAPREEG